VGEKKFVIDELEPHLILRALWRISEQVTTQVGLNENNNDVISEGKAICSKNDL
jgi:hypothetical protein